ncbi:hypothetical protein [Aequorivita aurantiaca]|uniref:hypothetical protein n=1 Tax=Aequorivita aurantiaca TaxID=3053356 RepID=UPI00338F7F1A
MKDSDSENLETQSWLDFAKESRYIVKIEFDKLINGSIEVGNWLNYMMNHSRIVWSEDHITDYCILRTDYKKKWNT